MNNDFFVMLNTQRGGITPLVTGDDNELATFKTEDEARRAASQNILGKAFGFEVFERGTGEIG